ncbi:MAG: hypothetical protein NXI30_22480 [bacterium]|nr:hypothetical protein [bacterium]
MASRNVDPGRRTAAAMGLVWLLVAPTSIAVEIDSAGQVATMPPISDHWVFVTDRLFQHSFVFDGDSGDLVATIPSGGTLTPKLPLVSRTRGEIYSIDVDYARGTRGERTDYVTVYDAETLDVRADILLTNPVSSSNTSLNHATLLDGDRFLAVFSQFPDTVVMIVDLEARAVVASAPIAGCAGVYATGARRVATLCGDGSTVQVSLDEDGSVASTERSERFFDVLTDPVSMVGVRSGAAWLFVSFLGQVHAIDYAASKPKASASWSLVSAAEKDAGWRPGGLQPHALHAATGRLFVLMHEGEAGSHKDASPEIWVFDIAEQARRARFDVPNLAVEFLGPMFGLAPGSFAHSVLGWLVPNEGAHSLVVSQDPSPLLFTRSGDFGVVGVIDPESGDHVRTLVEAGLSGPSLGVP